MMPYTEITEQPFAISSLFIFGWYDLIYYRDTRKGGFPYLKELLGIFLVLVEHTDNAMSQWVLNSNG